MILTKEVKIQVMYRNYEHFKSKGYDVKNGTSYIFPIEDVPQQSQIKVLVKCEVCGKERMLRLQQYMKNTKFGKTHYACSTKCAYSKNRQTNLEKYGVEHTMQRSDMKEKSIQTVKEKYGVDNISQTEYFKEKYKEVMLEKYGVENGFQSEDVKAKSKSTMIEKYGVPYNMQRQEMKEEFLVGENNNFYIHGEYDPNEWSTPEAKRLKTKMFSESKRTCVVCGKENSSVNLHHLYSRNTHKHLIYEESNLVVICVEHHKEFHDKYGYGNNTKEQFEEFLGYQLKGVTTTENIV